MKDDILLVGGTFGDLPYVSNVHDEIFSAILDVGKPNHWKGKIINGGTPGDLEMLLRGVESRGDYLAIIWLANITDNHDELLRNWCSNSILVTSMLRLNDSHTTEGMTSCINHGSDLAVIFDKYDDGYLAASVLDPLGNCFCTSNDYQRVGNVIGRRIQDLMSCRKIHSIQVGKKKKVPNETSFLEVLRSILNLDSASFRSTPTFPAFRKRQLIYVTKQDMEPVDRNAFIPVNHGGVNLQRWDLGDGDGSECFGVEYFGNDEPSTYAFNLLWLHTYYKNAKYIVHSHAYVVGGAFTDNIIPCGCEEETDEVIDIHHDRQNINFAVNLRGHGSVVIADSLEYLKGIMYVARSQPELHVY